MSQSLFSFLLLHHHLLWGFLCSCFVCSWELGAFAEHLPFSSGCSIFFCPCLEFYVLICLCSLPSRVVLLLIILMLGTLFSDALLSVGMLATLCLGYGRRTRKSGVLLDGTWEWASPSLTAILGVPYPKQKHLATPWIWNLGRDYLEFCLLTTLASEYSQKLGRSHPGSLWFPLSLHPLKIQLHGTVLNVCKVAQLFLLDLQQMLSAPDFSVLSKPSFHLKISEHFPCLLNPTPQILFI